MPETRSITNPPTLSPDGAELAQQAMRHHQAGRLAEAEQGYRHALRIDPMHFHALRLLGALYLQQEKYAEAEPLLRQALQLSPENPELLNNIGVVSHRYEHKFEEALAAFEKVLQINPDHIEALTNCGNVLSDMDRISDAEFFFSHALRLKSNHVSALVGIGNIYFDQNRVGDAQTKYRQALHHDPRAEAAILGLGNIKRALGQREKALSFYAEALTVSPRNVAILYAFGSLYEEMGDSDKALEYYEKALLIDPKSELSLFNKGHILLARGDYREGFRLYESRAQIRTGGPKARAPLPGASWNGAAYPGKSLLLWPEQGYGDLLQFVRYAALCKTYFAEIYVLCYPSLINLFRNCSFIDDVFDSIEGKKIDEHISIMSLPHIFDTTLETIPAQVPYLYVSAAARAKWAGKAADSGKLKVGLVWAGDARKYQLGAHMIDRRRSMNLEALRPLFDVPDIQFYSLQMGEPAAQIDGCGLRDRFIDLMPDVKDFEDTAAIVEQLDLVIAVDTSIVHLVGGLGKPIWVLSRYDACWRWLQNRETNPWYPTARVFGQPAPGDWASVVDNVRRALVERAATR